MANEVRVTGTLQIRKTTSAGKVLTDYMARPNSFQADMDGFGGPFVGGVVVTIYGTDIDLSALTTYGGWCRIYNSGTIDGDNSAEHYLEIGIWDPEFLRFHPIHELLPGEYYDARLSRNLPQEYGTGTGTGTVNVGPGTSRLRMRAGSTKSINAQVEAFNK
jgi:hypothetical protein